MQKLDYLKSLGVNAIELMPVQEFDGNDSWGYNPCFFFALDKAYGTKKMYKDFIDACHKAGMAVIFDVVYNHATGSMPFAKLYWNSANNKTAPNNPYFNVDAPHPYSVFHDFNHESPLVRKFVKRNLQFLLNEYHIDGFRFDLMGVHDIETMKLIRAAVDKIDPSIYIYGEGWSAGSCAYPNDQLAMKANTFKLNGIGAFSDDMRDALRGPFSDNTKGAFLAGIPGEEESLKFGIVGGIAHPQVDMNLVNYDKKPWTAEPTQQISYVSCHDDMCLVDRLKATVPGIKDASRTESERIAELIRLDLLAQTAVFTSQGVPFFLAGEEMLRDKKGVHNSYCSPDSINEFNWENLKKYPQVFEYYRNLIQLRKNHPAFRLAKAEAVREHLEFLPTAPVAEQKKDGAQVEKNGCLLAFRLKNLEGIDSWKNIIVIFNANKEARTVAIPQGEYHVACCNGVINEDGIGMPLVGNETIIDGQSALILYQK
jgi:pullulanase